MDDYPYCPGLKHFEVGFYGGSFPRTPARKIVVFIITYREWERTESSELQCSQTSSLTSTLFDSAFSPWRDFWVRNRPMANKQDTFQFQRGTSALDIHRDLQDSWVSLFAVVAIW